MTVLTVNTCKLPYSSKILLTGSAEDSDRHAVSVLEHWVLWAGWSIYGWRELSRNRKVDGTYTSLSPNIFLFECNAFAGIELRHSP